MPGNVSVFVNRQPRPLRGRSLMEVMAVEDRQPGRFAAYFRDHTCCQPRAVGASLKATVHLSGDRFAQMFPRSA